MFFQRASILALLCAPLVAFAQNMTGSNPFINSGTFSATAGQSVTLQWQPTTEGTVSLVLRDGASSNLNVGTVIASAIDNSGSYTWDVPADTVFGSDYTVEIISDSNPTDVNYTPYFVINSTVTVASSSASTVTLGAPSTSLALSTDTPTATVTSTSAPATTGTTTDQTTLSTQTSSSSSSSSSTAATTNNAAQESASAAAVLTPTHSGVAPRATVMAGMIGALALGALAL